MATKPTDVPQWATDHTPDPVGTPGDPLNPNVPPSLAKQGDGFAFEETVPFNWLNWLFYIAFTWIEWLQFYVETHVHTGGSGDAEAPKINLTSAIDYGDEGELEVTVDTPSEHRIEHRPTGAAVTVTQANYFNGSVLRVGESPGTYVDIDDESGFADVRSLRFAGSHDTGLASEVVKVTRSVPPGGNFNLLFPADSTLYKGNLNKAVGAWEFTEAGGLWSNSEISRFNISGNFLTSGSPALPANTWGLELGAINISGVVVHSITSLDGKVYTADVEHDSANTRLILTVKYWDTVSSSWLNARLTAPSGGNFILNLIII